MILLIDNYDSFVYNLERYFVELGWEVKVVRNDIFDLQSINNNTLDDKPLDGIVISPGPCTPREAGVSLDIIRQFSGSIPILGVCLGHQCIGAVFGARVVRAFVPMHGKTSCLQHNMQQTGLFKGLPETFDVMRYHSLVLEPESLPDSLMRTAWVDGEDTIMAVQHKDHPTYGVQFHPESILTEYGHALLRNFIDCAKEFRRTGLPAFTP